VDRSLKRRQVKPLAASLLDALDYDSSDDSDFEVGDASGSEGTGNGSDEEGSKVSAAGSESDSDNAASADDGIDEEEAKDLAAEDNLTEDEEKSKQQPSSDSSTKDNSTVTPPKGRRKSKKMSEPEPDAAAGTESAEPKKWNFRRNRPLLDFTTMEELNEMDDYDSEDDNDWRPTAGKKKGKRIVEVLVMMMTTTMMMMMMMMTTMMMKRTMTRKMTRKMVMTTSIVAVIKLNTPAILKAPKERKTSKKEGGTQGKSTNLPAILYSCGICKKNQDQHLLVLCDTCKLYYHLGCLEPPLTRMPKKTKNSYWQCSECDQASSDEANIAMETLPDGTKRSRRQIKGPIKFIPQEMSPEPKKHQVRGTRTRGQKRKRVPICDEREDKIEEPLPRERRQRQSAVQKKPKADDTRTECTTCKGPGDNENLVRCDECRLCYHFGCLDPPLKKSPKQTGYGWICQECDTSSSKVSVYTD
uniref:PHD finger protein 14 n=1 Tax=Amphilophus citrinellus TaxID=61819 RepID=A0A3Q0RRF0_AMPCI